MVGRPHAAAQDPHSCVRVWDSSLAPASEAFGIFRDAVCQSFMPWSPEPGEGVFRSRIESVSFPGGTIGRSSTSGIISRKTKQNISRSAAECIYGTYVTVGELLIDQGDHTSVVKVGDLVLYHSHRPIFLTERCGARNSNISFSIPTTRYQRFAEMENRCHNTVIESNKLLDPLSSCLNILSNSLSGTPASTIEGLFEAISVLLPISVDCDDSDSPIDNKNNFGRLKTMHGYIDQNLDDPEFGISDVAIFMNVSRRSIQKYFARSGTTFAAYLTSRRLDRVRSDLRSRGRHTSISDVAFRWGFSDLSTFNRAFKRCFGHTPRSLRD